jgi:hypothetical protein
MHVTGMGVMKYKYTVPVGNSERIILKYILIKMCGFYWVRIGTVSGLLGIE